MLSRFIKICSCFLILLLFACVETASAQNKYDAISFRIDSLAAVGLPKSALKEVERLDKLAHDEKNAAQQIRTVIYRMNFQSYLEEEALVAIIGRLKKDIAQAQYPAKQVMQSMQAEMYWNYYKENRYQFSQRSHLESPGEDYTKWDLQTIISETCRLYNLSLAEAKLEQETPVNVLDGVLAGDKRIRYLRPALYDLLAQRALDFYLNDEPELIKPKMAFSVDDPAFFLDAAAFVKLPLKTIDTASVWYQGIKLLQQLTAFHLKTPDEEALADLDLQRLKFLQQKSKLSNAGTLYLKNLQAVAAKYAAKPISAEALVLIGRYYQDKDSLVIARSYFDKAREAYPNSISGKNAVVYIHEVEEKALSAKLENTYAPGKALLASLEYRNAKQAKFSIYKLNDAQISKLKKDNEQEDEEQELMMTPKVYSFVNHLQPLETGLLSLPDPQDYKSHRAEFKIAPLQPGNYIIVLDDPSLKKSWLTGLAQFKVSGLAFTTRVRPDGLKEIRVLDRDSGKPLPGININVFSSFYNYNTRKRITRPISNGLSDAGGAFSFAYKGEQFNFTLSTGNDTFKSNNQTIYGYSETTEPDAQPVKRTILFTDRQIYRPGQTVYFKGLEISTLNNKSKVVADEYEVVNFFDANAQKQSSLNLKTNEYGTIAGSFIIPQQTLAGVMTIRTDHGVARIRVEEYKRPTFQVTFDPVKVAYRFNDSVRVKGNVKAFSGYNISGARVAYHVKQIPTYRPYYLKYLGGDYEDNARQAEVASDTVKTDVNGAFQIIFKASPGEGKTPDMYNYAITADVTDGSGETQSANTFVKVSNNVLDLELSIPDQLSAKDETSIPVKLNNINDQPQNGVLALKLYALRQPDSVFKKRLWDAPDQYLMTADEFKKQFTGYAYKNEDDKHTWPVGKTIIETDIKVTDTTTSRLDLGALKQQATGVYKLVIEAKNDKGDTTSQTYFIRFNAEPGIAPDMESWVNTIAADVNKVGDTTEFWLGISRESHILVEKYEGAKMLSSQWLTVGGQNQQRLKIAVPATAKNNFAVQFLMLNDNRLYTLYKQLPVKEAANDLNIKLLSSRNKLQPGEKDKWKIQVSAPGKEKEQAELLAAMYDASLDDITQPLNWSPQLSTPYNNPDYFRWSGYSGVVQAVATNNLDNEPYNSYVQDFVYETLNWLGYEYWGGYNYGYNHYIETVKEHQNALAGDKHINEKFIKNAALVKNGYVVSGRILGDYDAPLPGVKIVIKGTNISTLSTSLGYYKIKVPKNATLVFSKENYPVKYIKSPINGCIRMGLGGLVNVTTEYLKGNASGLNAVADMAVAEPVGNSDMKQYAAYDMAPIRTAREIAKSGAFNNVYGNNGYNNNSKVIMREIQTKPGQKFDNELLPSLQQTPRSIILRKNFNETAFFYPQLRTDDKGQILIEFTIPEALTKWKFRAFAHNKQLQFGYTETTVVTQKQLSINANMPRFLREGDTVTVSARLSNLETGPLKGKVGLKLFNAINMQPVDLFVNKADAQQRFEIAANSTQPVSFKLVVPAGLDALTYTLTADAGKFSDGEENTLPVLPNRMLVTESMPMMIRAGQSKTFSFDKLMNQNSTTLQNKALTLEYTQNPAWYAVQAIPYMMEFPYECSEQLFSRYYANSLSTDLIAKMPVIKQVFDRWKDGDSKELLSNLEKNQELKNTLLEETPWLQDAISESEQKKRIAQLFDLNKMTYEMKANLDKLKEKQLPNGAFPWFGGSYADDYITRHILEGIGQLRHLKTAAGRDGTLIGIANVALGYMEGQLIKADKEAHKQKNYPTRGIDADEIHAWYVQSYFTGRSLSNDLTAAFDNYLKRAEEQWVTQSIYQQGMIALTMARSGKQPVAAAIVKSLMETAQQAEDKGMYWGKNLSGYYWYQSPIETQSLMIELFTETGGNAKAVEEMKIWLMLNKQTNNWQTTKATAAAVYALLLKQENWLQNNTLSEIKIDGKSLASLKPEVKADAGTGYIKTNWADEQVKPGFGKVEVKNNGASISYGAMYWQYLEQMDKITPAKTDLTLERKYFIEKQTDAGLVLQEVDAAHQPKTGDLLKVVVYLKAGRDYEYVQLKDLRPAGTEPVSTLSDYKYQDGLWYYQVTKDVATNFFISHLNKGNYVFEYELRVAQPGNFSTGITSIQCMYAPEFNAHSEGRRVVFK
ncbi:alpha-2-macroglobulin family protein [Mucilaginibacter celer]|nr:alpha-2-macroglobulin family protein [Mucilaginibacter celer]